MFELSNDWLKNVPQKVKDQNLTQDHAKRIAANIKTLLTLNFPKMIEKARDLEIPVDPHFTEQEDEEDLNQEEEEDEEEEKLNAKDIPAMWSFIARINREEYVQHMIPHAKVNCYLPDSHD